MVPPVREGTLGSRYQKVGAREQKPSQRPGDETFRVVSCECRHPDREPYGEEVEASLDKGGSAVVLVEVLRYAAEG